MAKQYLDKDGLLYFWQKIKTYFTGTATPKMDGTATVGTATKFSREDHIHPSDTTKVDKVSGKGLSTNDYTTAEKNKLAAIAAGAEVNQNAFSNVKVGSTTVAADGKTDTLELVAGNNVTINPDATNDRVTISATDTTYTPASETPLMDGTGAVGTSAKYAREDHVHPSDSYKVDKVDGMGLSTVSDIQFSISQEAPNPEKMVITYVGGSTSDEYEMIGSDYLRAYGECSTAAATTAKTVTVNIDGNFANPLKTGAIVYVKFTVTNTGAVASLTLNVNDTGAKPIKYRGANLSSAGVLAANRIYCFVYDGTNWQIVGDLDTNTTYANYSLGHGYGTCATDANTLAKVVTLSNYILATGGYVAVKFDHAVQANATMNINSKGAKNIYYKGAKIVDAIIEAGDIAVFIYDGSYYQLLTVDSSARSANSTHRGLMSSAMATKLNGIAAGAQVNTITGVKGSAESSYRTGQVSISAANVGAIATSAKGAANGVCPLNASSKIDSTYLPSYVDDVIEAYARSEETALSSTWLSTTSGGAALTPEAGKIYVLMADSGDYSANTQFRWGGTAYVKLADGGVSSITNSEIDTIIAA